MSDLRDYGPFEMAHGFDDPRKIEDDMFRIAAQNAEDANARLAVVVAQRDELLTACRTADAAMNPPDRDGISLHVWNRRLKEATAVVRAAIAKATGQPLPDPPSSASGE
jgi:hypothetical protein